MILKYTILLSVANDSLLICRVQGRGHLQEAIHRPAHHLKQIHVVYTAPAEHRQLQMYTGTLAASAAAALLPPHQRLRRMTFLMTQGRASEILVTSLHCILTINNVIIKSRYEFLLVRY